jgi:ABC-type glycerol-3-phosphate transport system permease component
MTKESFKRKLQHLKFRGAKKANRSRFVDFLLGLFLLLLGAFMVMPIWLVIINAFKPIAELFIFPPRFYVAHPTLENFVQLGQILQNMWVPFSRYLFNSILVTVVATVGNVIVGSLAAYPLAKHNFPGKKFISKLIVLALLFTTQILYIPQYIISAKLHLINTYWSLILPVVQSTIGVFLMQQFMGQIPTSLLEAARIDGAGEFKIWWSIVMPSVKPAWLTVIIFAFQNIWSQNGNLYIYNESMKVLPSITSQVQAGGLVRAGPAAAVMLVLMLPPLILFEATQKQVIETMTTSGIKE